MFKFFASLGFACTTGDCDISAEQIDRAALLNMIPYIKCVYVADLNSGA